MRMAERAVAIDALQWGQYDCKISRKEWMERPSLARPGQLQSLWWSPGCFRPAAVGASGKHQSQVFFTRLCVILGALLLGKLLPIKGGKERGYFHSQVEELFIGKETITQLESTTTAEEQNI